MLLPSIVVSYSSRVLSTPGEIYVNECGHSGHLVSSNKKHLKTIKVYIQILYFNFVLIPNNTPYIPRSIYSLFDSKME